jgi:transposase
MRKTELKNHLEQAEIRKEMQDSETREQFQRWQAIYLVRKGLRVEQVAEYIGITKGTVYQWVFQYNHEGPESFQLRGRGGRRFGLMSFEEEADFLEHLRAEAARGEIVGAFWLRERLEKKLGHKVSKDYLYDLLHRHDWRKVVPRPRHPNADVEKQEEFKKNSRSWWQPPPRASRRKIPGH